MNERGKSDNLVVPAKPPNNAGGPVAEVVEGRGLAEGNTDSSTRAGRSAGQRVPSGLERVREVARRDKDARFTALLHHVDLDRLWAAYAGINPKAAPGTAGVRAAATTASSPRSSSFTRDGHQARRSRVRFRHRLCGPASVLHEHLRDSLDPRPAPLSRPVSPSPVPT